MKVIIEFDCDNAAFHPEDGSENLARRLSVFTYAVGQVLERAKDKIYNQFLESEDTNWLQQSPGPHDVLLDVNGNRIGSVKLVRELEPICAKCKKEHDGSEDFMMAIDVEDGQEKLMCAECVEAQGGHGFEYQSEK